MPRPRACVPIALVVLLATARTRPFFAGPRISESSCSTAELALVEPDAFLFCPALEAEEPSAVPRPICRAGLSCRSPTFSQRISETCAQTCGDVLGQCLLLPAGWIEIHPETCYPSLSESIPIRETNSVSKGKTSMSFLRRACSLSTNVRLVQGSQLTPIWVVFASVGSPMVGPVAALFEC